MALDAALRKHLIQLLTVSEETDSAGQPLVADARRLWERLRRFIDMPLAGTDLDSDALELACSALQLPRRKRDRTSLRQRCEDAAELMVSSLSRDAEERLLDRAVRVLHEMPQKSPMLDEARLLADAFNLEDFGLIGLFQQAMILGTQGQSVEQICTEYSKREDYGYWQARLNGGFHYEPVRQMARRRLEEAIKVCGMLKDELGE